MKQKTLNFKKKKTENDIVEEKQKQRENALSKVESMKLPTEACVRRLPGNEQRENFRERERDNALDPLSFF